MATKWVKVEYDRASSPHSGVAWSRKQKLTVVANYLLIGNLAEAARMVGVSPELAYEWRRQDWWKEAEHDLRRQSRQELSGKLGQIIKTALKVIEDRLENGDFVYDNKQGKMVRKPINAAVAHAIASQSIDRSALLERLQREDTMLENQDQMQDRLLKLYEEFKRFNKAKTIPGVKGGDPESTEVENTDAIHEKREEGLQT